MVDRIKLKVNKRSLLGRQVKKLRRQGILPANIYGKDVKSLAVQLPLKDFQMAFDKSGETSIIEISVDKVTKTRPVLIQNLQYHPVSGDPLHADFYQVDLTKKVTVNIPIELKGEAPAIIKGGVLIQLLDEVEVEALPTNLPEKFVVDISGLEEIGQKIDLKVINIDTKKVKLTVDNLEELIVKIEEPAKEEEEEKPIEAEGEVAEEEDKKEGEKKEEDTKPEEEEKPKEANSKPKKEKEDKKEKEEEK